MSDKRERKLAYQKEYYRTHPEYRERKLAYQKEYDRTHPEHREKQAASNAVRLREYYRTHREEKVAYKREYRKNHPECREKEAAYQREYRKNNPEKVEARNRARNLPLSGVCEKCGSTENLEHHHPDYSQPNLFETLCRECHNRLHWKE